MLAAALGLFVGSAVALEETAGSISTNAPGTVTSLTESVTLRGRVVCLAEEMHRLHGTDLPAEHQHLFGFRTQAGKYYTLLRTRFSEALFADPRVQKRELLLKARRLSGSDLLDVSRFFGIRDGRLEEISYFCKVCIIHEPGPSPCPCCQDELELTITPTDQLAP